MPLLPCRYSVVSTLSQFYIFIPSIVKDCYLTYLLRLEEEEKEKKEGEEDIDDKPVNTISTVIVFASTCRYEKYYCFFIFNFSFYGTHLASFYLFF